jgi:hypothetical protein
LPRWTPRKLGDAIQKLKVGPTLNIAGVYRKEMLTSIAAELYFLEAALLVSYLARRRSPVAAMVAAEESAGRGAGSRGALKSLFKKVSREKWQE